MLGKMYADRHPRPGYAYRQVTTRQMERFIAGAVEAVAEEHRRIPAFGKWLGRQSRQQAETD